MADRKLKILLAEDNKANQFISKAMIEALGSTVLIAENGFEVIEMVLLNSFDMILMDCQMPEMDGLEATKKIRVLEDETKKSIPIIALTADVQKETKAECLAAGMNDFISKPFSFDDLNAAIDQWVK